MMFYIAVSVALLFLAPASSTEDAVHQVRRGADDTAGRPSSLLCHVEMQVSHYEVHEEPRFSCVIDGLQYDVEFPPSFLHPRDYSRQLHEGSACVSIPNAVVDADRYTVTYPEAQATRLSLVDCGQQRELQVTYDTTGTKTLLVVRMSAYLTPTNKISPALSASDLEGHWFKTGSDVPSGKTVSLVDQFDNCSNGRLNVVKASWPNSDIRNGVLDVTAPFGTVINDEQTGSRLTNDMVAATTAHLGFDPRDEFRFVAFVFPDDVVNFVRNDGESRLFRGADAAFVSRPSNCGLCRASPNKIELRGHLPILFLILHYRTV